MSVLGVPVLTKPCFISLESNIGECWKQSLLESMSEAGREEKRRAEERGNYHEGVPTITVVVDGGWSKHSHKHSYNAKSGVAIIAGKETGKLLYIGVRNKFCAACSRNIPKENHICFRNWSKSSSEMESDILLQGFMEAERVHGIRYTRFIGDGDSSVHTTLLQGVPVWGHAIRKLECANHACKCYRGALEKLVQENHSYKGKGGLTLQMRKRLVSAARCAIRMRSAEPDRKKAVKLLQSDLVNGPKHCFGLHHACSPDFCSTAREAAAAARLVPATPPPTTDPSTASSSVSDSSSYSIASAPRFSVQSFSQAQNSSSHSFHSLYPITSAPSSSGSSAQAPTLSTCPVASAQSVVSQSVHSVQLLATPVTTSLLELETSNSSEFSSSISPPDHCFDLDHASDPTFSSTPMETAAARLALISPPTTDVSTFNFILSAHSNSSYTVSSAPRSSSQSDTQAPNSSSHMITLASTSRSPALAPNPFYPVASSPCFDSQSVSSVQNFSLLATPIPSSTISASGPSESSSSASPSPSVSTPVSDVISAPVSPHGSHCDVGDGIRGKYCVDEPK